jgi:hypothetical protein
MSKTDPTCKNVPTVQGNGAFPVLFYVGSFWQCHRGSAQRWGFR